MKIKQDKKWIIASKVFVEKWVDMVSKSVAEIEVDNKKNSTFQVVPEGFWKLYWCNFHIHSISFYINLIAQLFNLYFLE